LVSADELTWLLRAASTTKPPPYIQSLSAKIPSGWQQPGGI
jgi:hypothetical protein